MRATLYHQRGCVVGEEASRRYCHRGSTSPWATQPQTFRKYTIAWLGWPFDALSWYRIAEDMAHLPSLT